MKKYIYCDRESVVEGIRVLYFILQVHVLLYDGEVRIIIY